MNKSHDITIANTLIATTLDSMKGYKEASEDSETANAAFFCEMADERSKVASTLQAHVASLGGDPEDDSTVSGALHRGFMNLRELVSARDEKAIVAEVERGEDYIKAKYSTALEDGDVSPQTKAVIEQAYASIVSGHDKMSAMKHRMEG